MTMRGAYLWLGVGLLVGVVGGLAIHSAGEGTGGEERGARAHQRERLGQGGPGAEGREAAGRRGKSERPVGAASGSNRVEAVRDFLALLSEQTYPRDVDPLELARCKALIASLTESEVGELLETLRPRGDVLEESTVWNMLSGLSLSRLAELNGPEAMRTAFDWDMQMYIRLNYISLATVAWVEADPESAERWFRRGGKWPEFFYDETYVQEAFFTAMARVDGERARRLLLSRGVEGSIAGTVARLAKTPEDMKMLLMRVDDGTNDMMEPVFEEAVRQDLDLARDWLAGQPDLENRTEYVRDLAKGLVEENFEEGVAWYMEQRQSRTKREELYAEIVSLGHEKLDRVSVWLWEQPDSPDRDRAEKELAGWFGTRGDYAGAFRWANELSDVGDRRDVVHRIFRRGWSDEEGAMSLEVAEAARGAGFGEELEAYTTWRSGSD